jgi:hypothetical protein
MRENAGYVSINTMLLRMIISLMSQMMLLKDSLEISFEPIQTVQLQLITRIS